MTISELRTQHPAIRYQAYEYHFTPDGLAITFTFLLEPNITFTPTVTITGPQALDITQFSPPVLDNLVFHLGLIELFSYWKTACSPQIIIEAGSLDADQLVWWKKLLIQGMGEYFFVNTIDFTAPDFVTFSASSDTAAKYPDEFAQSLSPIPSPQPPQSILIPLGGGKDSVVTLELIKRAYSQDPDVKLGTLLVNPTGAAQTIADVSGLPQVTVTRHLDPQMLAMNKVGYLNGHTPFSALVAVISVLASYLYQYQYVPVSNERSSNEGNVRFLDHEINHQYSKTFDFERDFQEYVNRYLLPPALRTGFYFSFVRPLYELQIGRIFSGMSEYHSLFRSCNRGQKTNAWCGECPKCLFAFTILYPFLGRERMIDIFGQDLFENSALMQFARELTGYGETKPFECVGTHEESIAAFYLSREQALREYQALPALLAQIDAEILSQEGNLEQRAAAILTSWNPEHELPLPFEEILKTALAAVS
jgi:hypothetical protein